MIHISILTETSREGTGSLLSLYFFPSGGSQNKYVSKVQIFAQIYPTLKKCPNPSRVGDQENGEMFPLVLTFLALMASLILI